MTWYIVKSAEKKSLKRSKRFTFDKMAVKSNPHSYKFSIKINARKSPLTKRGECGKIIIN